MERKVEQKARPGKVEKQICTQLEKSRLFWFLQAVILPFIIGVIVLVYKKADSGEVDILKKTLRNTYFVKATELTKLIVNKEKETVQVKKEHTDKKEVKTSLTPETKFRSVPREYLSKDSVKVMLNQYNLFCSKYEWSKEYSNPYGRGFDNKFEKKNNDQIVYDHASGLMWQQSGSVKYMTYEKAKAYITELNKDQFAGYNDWRLPTLEEAMSLMEPPEKFVDLYRELFHIDLLFDKTQRWIWTSDLYNSSSAWMVSFYYGLCSNYYFTDNCYVRAVR